MAEQSLKDKTVKGTIWSGIDNVAQYVVSFVVSIILARLLSPDDYGLIGIIYIFTAICNSLINAGFSSALIRKKEITENDYSTAFIVNLGMSLLLYVVIFVCAPFISDFFNREELVMLTRVTTLGIVLGALGLVQQTRLTKRIDFKTQTKITLIVSVISGVVGIGMAFLGYGVWSLVVQGLVGQGLRTALLWFYNRWSPRLYFSKDSFRSLFGFGWKMMVSGLLATIWKELNQVVIGKFYSPSTLGQYTRARNFSELLSNNLTTVVQRVTFPVLSEIQDDTAKMVAAYRQIIKMTMFVVAISSILLAAISEPFIYCLIGTKWHDAAVYLPLICVAGSLYPLHAINLNMLQVQGRSDVFLKLEIVKKIVEIGPLAIGIFVGVIPMLYAAIVVGIIAYFLNSYYSGKALGYSSWMQIKDVAPSYAIAFLMAVVVWPLKFLPISCRLILILQLLVAVVVFGGINRIIKLEEYAELKKIVINIVSSVKQRRKNE